MPYYPLYFDIETAGLSTVEDDFICAGFWDGKNTGFATTLTEIEKTLDLYKREVPEYDNILLITYNGGNFYNTGFDFPFLRYKYMQEGKHFSFQDMYHLDLYPLVQKYLNLYITKEEPESKYSLKKADLVKLATANEVEYETKDKTYDTLMSLDNTDWLDYKKETKESKMDLQSIYQLLYDPNKEENYISGADVPEMYKTGRLDKIKEHVLDDVKQLAKVHQKLDLVLPVEGIERVIETL